MADPRGRRLARSADRSPEDRVREAYERQRRGEIVHPWELLPVGWVFYEAWRQFPDAKVEAIGPDGKIERFYVLEHPFPASKYPPHDPYWIASGMVPQMRWLGELDVQSWDALTSRHNRALFDDDGMVNGTAVVVPATHDPRYEYDNWLTVLIASRHPYVRDQDGQPKTSDQHTDDAWRNVLYAGAFKSARLMRRWRDKAGRLRWDITRGGNTGGRKGGRRRNPADPRRRRAERGELDQGAIARLIVERQRSGAIGRFNAEWARFFSQPFSPEANNLWPLWSGHYRRPVPRSLEIARPDPRTVKLHEALASVVPEYTPGGPVDFVDTLRSHYSSMHSAAGEIEHYLRRHGCGFEIDFEDDSEDPPFMIVGYAYGSSGVISRFERISDRYFESGPQWEVERLPDPATTDGGDVEIQDRHVCMFHLRESALAREDWALKVLAFLRKYSTVEYINVLGGWDAVEAWPPPSDYPKWQEVELQLVSNLLGGAPL